MKRINQKGIEYFTFNSFSRFSNLTHFVTTRNVGISPNPYDSLNFGFKGGDLPRNVLKNRRSFFKTLNIPFEQAVYAQQTHSNNLQIITVKQAGLGAYNYESAIPDTDALITNTKGICLGLLFADCVPIIFFDIEKDVVAIAHAGVNGTIKNISQKVVDCMLSKFSSNLVNIKVGIAPSIGKCCYFLKENTIKLITTHNKNLLEFTELNGLDGKLYLDLQEANRSQILAMGILPENVETSDICTYHNSNIFFSERFSGSPTGRFSLGAMLNE